ncbi:MAG TPA: DNA repair protein RecN [Acholeplasmataceae bacterium]|nr:DNA repair protein RecN [Acholeplasmataceae bacterium]
MLLSLTVKNFAIIDNIDIEFKNGMTVLTGETGAGKSLIIDAIGLLFGNRASTDLIRYGESKAEIEGVFSNYSKEINKYLDEFGIEYSEEDNLTIRREIYSTGKSTCRINNVVVTLNQLSQISEYIGDIHSQHDTMGLIKPQNYLQFITNKEIEKKLILYKTYLTEYRKINQKYQDTIVKSKESKQKEDFLRFQISEFQKANLSVAEEDELKNEVSYLSNYEQISSLLQEINEIYDNGEVLDNIYRSLTSLKKLESFNEKFSQIRSTVEECYYALESALDSPELKEFSSDFDPNRLEEINLRLSTYSNLKRKYQKNTEELIAYFEEIKEELDMIDNFDFYLDELKKKLDQSYMKTYEIAKDISNQRKEISKELITNIKKHLQDLQLKNINFEIEFKEVPFTNDGIDEVDFLVSFNKGEPVKPLSKTASGGELSRFMLALKTVIGNTIPLQTKIFDEIDNGVSGSVAYSIAEKIKYISKKSQVLCITHLPQVASIADYHLKISKEIIANRTFTKINVLDKEERVIEIAEMISKGKPTDASLALARELLSTNANF